MCTGGKLPSPSGSKSATNSTSGSRPTSASSQTSTAPAKKPTVQAAKSATNAKPSTGGFNFSFDKKAEANKQAASSQQQKPEQSGQKKAWYHDEGFKAATARMLNDPNSREEFEIDEPEGVRFTTCLYILLGYCWKASRIGSFAACLGSCNSYSC